jgi:sulfur carrier protein
MRILVNGTPREVTAGCSIAALVSQSSGIAVALNGVVVSRAEWSVTRFDEGDAVEVLTAHQGG